MSSNDGFQLFRMLNFYWINSAITHIFVISNTKIVFFVHSLLSVYRCWCATFAHQFSCRRQSPGPARLSSAKNTLVWRSTVDRKGRRNGDLDDLSIRLLSRIQRRYLTIPRLKYQTSKKSDVSLSTCSTYAAAHFLWLIKLSPNASNIRQRCRWLRAKLTRTVAIVWHQFRWYGESEWWLQNFIWNS